MPEYSIPSPSETILPAVMENPYATPNSQLSITKSYGWETSGNFIHTGTSAQLPLVDPCTGKTGSELVAHTLTIKVIPLSYPFIQAIGATLYYVSFSLDDPLLNVLLIASATVINLVALAKVGKNGSICLSFFCARATWLKFHVGLATLVIFLIFAAITAFSKIDIPSSTWTILIVALMGLLFLLRLFMPGLTCRRKINGSFEIRGLHPDALTYLREEELKQSNSSQSAAPSHI